MSNCFCKRREAEKGVFFERQHPQFVSESLSLSSKLQQEKVFSPKAETSPKHKSPEKRKMPKKREKKAFICFKKYNIYQIKE